MNGHKYQEAYTDGKCDTDDNNDNGPSLIMIIAVALAVILCIVGSVFGTGFAVAGAVVPVGLGLSLPMLIGAFSGKTSMSEGSDQKITSGTDKPSALKRTVVSTVVSKEKLNSTTAGSLKPERTGDAFRTASSSGSEEAVDYLSLMDPY